MKFIKFTLKKDIKNNRIIFIPHYYNSNNPFHGQTYSIDYLKKKVRREFDWKSCFINETFFTISFSGGITPREYSRENRRNQIFRLGLNSNFLDREYYFDLNPDESIDFYYNRIIESFKILSQRIR